MSATAVARVKERLDARFEGNRPAKSWTLAVIGGALLISMTTAIGLALGGTGKPEADHPVFAMLRLAAPVIIMAIYALDGSRYARREKEQAPLLYAARIGQLADSLYFLGFLWTLWALIDCFVIHQMSIAQAVFRAFGYALVTTASGMFLRLLLLQFRYGDGAADQTDHIERQIQIFTRELSGAVDALGAFRRQSDEALTAWIASLTASCATVRQNVEAVQNQTGSLKDELVKVYQTAVEHNGRAVQGAVDEFNRRVEPNLARINKANEDLATVVADGSRAVESTMRSGASAVAGAIGSGTRQIGGILGNSAEELQGTLRRNTQTLAMATAEFVRGSGEQMGQVEDAIAGVAGRIREIRVPPEIVERVVTRQTEVAMSRLSDTTARLERAIKQLTATVEDSTQQMRRLRRKGWFRGWWDDFWGD
jgi:hypothetical protein